MSATRTARAMGCAAAFVLAGALGAFHATKVRAGEPRFENLLLSDAKEGAAKKVFTANTPRVVLTARLADVPSGSKLKSVWIAEKTKVASPNYEIDKTELTGGGAINRVTFSLSRPNAGWPSGDYRLELFINGKPAGTVRFSVAP